MRRALAGLLGGLLLGSAAPVPTTTATVFETAHQIVLAPAADKKKPKKPPTFEVEVDYDRDNHRFRIRLTNTSERAAPGLVMVRPNPRSRFQILDFGTVAGGATKVSAWQSLVGGARKVLAVPFDPQRDTPRIDARSGAPKPLVARLAPMLDRWAAKAVDALTALKGRRGFKEVSPQEAVELVSLAVAAGASEALQILVNQGRLQNLEQLVSKLRETLGHKGLSSRREGMAEVVETARWAKLYPGHLVVLDARTYDKKAKKWVKADVQVIDPVTKLVVVSVQLKSITGGNPLGDDNLPKALKQLVGKGNPSQGATEQAATDAKGVAVLNVIDGVAVDWTMDDLIEKIAEEIAGPEETNEPTPVGLELLDLLPRADDVVLRTNKGTQIASAKDVLGRAQRAAAAVRAARLMTPAPSRGGPATAPQVEDPKATKTERPETERAPKQEPPPADQCQAPDPGRQQAPGNARAPWGRLEPAAVDCGELTEEEIDRLAEELADELTRPGGIDFSSLGLRYLSLGEGQASGVDFAFHADRVRGRSRGDGLRNATQASDAFFVWLALRPTAFVVNLKPDEPDRVMDRDFGRTEAGRILLEADLRLKQEAAWAIHPRTDLGRRFWQTVGSRCVPGSRLWITPGVAKVREEGDALYILDAPLRVDQEQWTYTPSPGDPQPPGPATCPGQSAAEQRRLSATYRRMVLPVLRRAVNEAPEFADLRRVYLSRVAAEWYRERSEDGGTRFAGIIDSGNIERWVRKDKWRPRDTFRRYLRSFTEGEYTATMSNQTYRWSITVGGVDFGHVGEDDVGRAAFDRGWPGMDDRVRDAVAHAGTGNGDDRWLGGRSQVDPDVLAEEFPSTAPHVDEPGGPSTRRLLVIGLIAAGGLFVAFGVVRGVRSRPKPRQG